MKTAVFITAFKVNMKILLNVIFIPLKLAAIILTNIVDVIKTSYQENFYNLFALLNIPFHTQNSF